MKFLSLLLCLTLATSATAKTSDADLLKTVQVAYERVLSGKPEEATTLLIAAIDDYGSPDGVAISYAYAALADIDKFVAAGAPQPFDGNHIGAEGNKYEDVILQPSSPRASQYLGKAEAALLAMGKDASDDQADSVRSNMWFHLASIYARIPDKERRCQALDKSLQHHLLFAKAHPTHRFNVLGRVGTSSDFQWLMAYRKKGAGCTN